jgi:hypothetical protein
LYQAIPMISFIIIPPSVCGGTVKKGKGGWFYLLMFLETAE